MRPPAIAGVSTGAETVICTEYPSIAALGLGRLVGRLYESIPLGIGVIKLSYVLMTLLVIPPLLALKLYVYLKLFGSRYVLTNRSVQVWSMLGQDLRAQVPLAEVADIALQHLSGQEFYHAADLVLLGADGRVLLRLEGVKRAEIFRQTILQARDARVKTEASLAAIKARK